MADMASGQSSLSRTSQGIWWLDGDCLIEARRALRLQSGVEHALDRSAYEILRHLALNAGEVCTQDELLEAGWPGRRVTNNSLAQCVSRLRRQLGDDAGQRLAVVHRFGYRLIAAVRYELEAAPHPLATTIERPVLRRIPHRADWEVSRMLGRGGTGEVWLAESATGEQRAYKLAHHESGLRGLKREVALHRLIKAHHRQLSSHDPLVDWNLEVAPFFVATRFHPEGNLAEWCRAEDRLARMAIADRVALAESLCRSVAALHAADIAHRDLKPENLYPETFPDGRWRVLLGDLGVGVGFLPPGIDENGVLLGQLTRMGADEDVRSQVSIYVAPEVLGGQPATAKSDNYALGVLIYQLVVGDLRRALAPGWHHDIENPWLREDIELAANVSPDRRTVSAEQLADRLATLTERERAAHHARAEAQALAESTHRLKVMRQRWRWGIALGLALAVFAAVSGGLAIKAERLRLQAQQHATEAQAVRSFLTDQLLVQADPYSGQRRDVTLKQALDLASESVETDFADSPAIATEVHLALAAIYEGWAEYPATLKHQQAALAQLRLDQPMSEKTAAQERNLCEYGRRASNYDLAADACSRAAEIERHLQGELSLETMVTQAKLDFERGRWLPAVEALTAVIDASGDVATDSTLFIEALWFRGLSLTQQGRFVASQADFHRLLPLTAQHYGEDHPQYGWVAMDFAETLIIAGDFEGARPLLDTATRIFIDRLGATHADAAVPMYLQARMHLWKGDPAAASPLYERVLAQWTEQLGKQHLWTLFTQTELAWAYACQSNPEGVSAELRSSLPAALDLSEYSPGRRSFFLEAWTRIHLALGGVAKAEELHQQLLHEIAAWEQPNPARVARATCLQAEIDWLNHQQAASERSLTRCEALTERALEGLPHDNYQRDWVASLRRKIKPN